MIQIHEMDIEGTVLKENIRVVIAIRVLFTGHIPGNESHVSLENPEAGDWNLTGTLTLAFTSAFF